MTEILTYAKHNDDGRTNVETTRIMITIISWTLRSKRIRVYDLVAEITLILQMIFFQSSCWNHKAN